MTFAYDCEGAEAAWVRANLPLPNIMLWYGTGSNGIPWTPAERALFPTSVTMVEIDQGGAGTPVPGATVRDVENGAWGPGQAVNRNGWTAERPTIYCSRNTLPSVLADGWKGDILLAWPGWQGEALPSAPGCNYVAVQDVFGANYDHSTILDATWPFTKTPPPPATALSVTVISRVADLAWTSVPCDHYSINYTPPGGQPEKLISVEPVTGTMVHDMKLGVPGSNGGALTVWAIQDGKGILVGEKSLP